jgi:hypothetical protein
MSTGEPLRLHGEVHPVPLVFAVLFGCLALVGAVLALAGDTLSVGVVVFVIFATLAVLFALECIPPWVEIDAGEIRYREKLRKGRVRYAEIRALGIGLENEENAGSLLVRLTDAACAERGIVRRDASFHVSIPAVPSCRQKELLERAVARWQEAGGSGETFSLLEDFLESGRSLRRAASDLMQLQADDDVYCSVLHVKNDSGGLFFCIVAGSERLEDLAHTIRHTAERLVREHRFNPEFGGEIQISLVPDLTPNTSALKERMDSLVRDLEASLPKLAQNRAVTLTWTLGLRNHSE